MSVAGRGWRCWTSTLTSSRRLTTRSDIRLAMRCCRSSQGDWCTTRVTRTSWRGSVATSSPSSWRLIQQPTEATRLANRILALFDAPFDVAGHHIVIDTSIGIAFAPEDGTENDQILKNASLALSNTYEPGDNANTARIANMARELQNAMLPQRYPSFAAGRGLVRFHHYFTPSMAVSGDFFNVCKISDTEAGIFICDVMGHGVRAALVAAMMHTLLGEAHADLGDPAALLTHLNRTLRDTLKSALTPMFATAFYVVGPARRRIALRQCRPSVPIARAR